MPSRNLSTPVSAEHVERGVPPGAHIGLSVCADGRRRNAALRELPVTKESPTEAEPDTDWSSVVSLIEGSEGWRSGGERNAVDDPGRDGFVSDVSTEGCGTDLASSAFGGTRS
jgi:hypothetical protein